MSKLPPLDVTQVDRQYAADTMNGALMDFPNMAKLCLEHVHCRERQLEDALTRLEKAEELLTNTLQFAELSVELEDRIKQYMEAER